MYRYKLAAVVCRDVGVQTDFADHQTSVTTDDNKTSAKADLELTQLLQEKQV